MFESPTSLDLTPFREQWRRSRRGPRDIKKLAETMLTSYRYHLEPGPPYDAAKFLQLCGFRVEQHEELTTGIGRDGRPRTYAGILVPMNGLVMLSRAFGPRVMRFTVAHEAGHLVMHPHMTELHRDPPLDGSRNDQRRPQLEEQADTLAAYFCMPEDDIRSAFWARFHTGAFELNDATAFALFRANIWDVRPRWKSMRVASRELAGANCFDRYPFNSLADQFGVSLEAMAIRLEELDLLAPDPMWTPFRPWS